MRFLSNLPKSIYHQLFYLAKGTITMINTGNNDKTFEPLLKNLSHYSLWSIMNDPNVFPLFARSRKRSF